MGKKNKAKGKGKAPKKPKKDDTDIMHDEVDDCAPSLGSHAPFLSTLSTLLIRNSFYLFFLTVVAQSCVYFLPLYSTE